jgi:hypothetical protein
MKKQLEQLIESFKASGLTLNESQQTELTSFVDALEAKINEAREEGKATAKEISIKLAEAALEEYDVDVKEATEDLIKAIDEKTQKELPIKVSEAVEAEKETLVEKVDDYLKLYIKELIPESLVVDYDRMQRQMKAINTIKETLLVTDDIVHNKAQEISETITGELAEAKQKLNETIEKNMKLNKVIQIKMADEILESKLEDLPSLEASKLRKYFESATAEEIEDQFETVYESITASLKDGTSQLDESDKIKEILDDDEETDETKIDEKLEKKLDALDPMMESWVARLKTIR